MATLQLHNITKRFGDTEVIKGIDLEVNDREFVVFVGPSGCGKSTLMRMIAGLESATDGDILIDGQRINDVGPADRGLAMVFQSYALYPHMTVEGNMGFSMRLAGVPKEERRAKVLEAAKILQLEPLLDRKPKALSGGQRQRVAIGRAIVRNPSIFLFDEPLSNLDAALRVQMRIELARLHDELDATMIYVTHDQIEAMTLGDKVAVMKDGIVQQFGTPKEIYNNPANLFVASFIGSPPMNFIPLRLTRQADGWRALLESGQDRCELPLNLADGQSLEGREVILGIRPEQISIGTEADLSSLRAEVQVIEPTGPDTMIFVSLNQTKVCCRLAPDAAPNPGESLTLQFEPEKVLLFDAQTGERLGVAPANDSTGRNGTVTRLVAR